jgi:hypothetical protein
MRMERETGWMGAVRAILGLLCCAPLLAGASLSVLVKDPSGAVVAGAAVAAASKALPSTLQAATDAQGRAILEPLPAGTYQLSVSKDGFEVWERTVNVADKPTDLVVSLKLKSLTTTVQVSGRRSPLANSDPNYIAMRGGKLTQVYRVENLVLRRDVGNFTFRSGSFSFLPPVLGHVAIGVFVGDGHFQLKPAFDLAAQHLQRIAGTDRVEEDFIAMVVYFSDSTFDEIKQHSQLADESPSRHEAAFKRVKDVLERRVNPEDVTTLLQRLLNSEDIPNYEAEILAELYNPAQRGSFRAFLHGKKHPDLRFLLNPLGAMPMLAAPEEIALLNYEPSSESDGIWYLSHRTGELVAGTASSTEDKRLIAPEHYQIDAFIRPKDLIGKEPDMAVTCDLRFRSLADGTRMVKFDLVPDLQVSRVVWKGKEIPFVQEGRKRDGSFYLQMPEALAKDRTYQITFEYAGGEILESGDFVSTVAPRRVWYPMPAGPSSRATYDLKYHIPGGMTIVSVGEPAGQTREGSFHVFEFTSETPIAQAVFRYLGEVFTKSTTEATIHTELAAYVLGSRGTGAQKEAPPPGPSNSRSGGAMQVFGPLGTDSPSGFEFTPVQAGLPPSSPAEVLVDASNAERVLHAWFGAPAYGRLSVVEGRGPSDSLPGMIYAPPAVFAGTQSQTRGTAKTFLDEAFAHQVALQWWDNTVSPASFHDQWLSAGFANFSASVYDLVADPADFLEHWQRAHDILLQPTASGVRRNDAGPLWMGLLNNTWLMPGAAGALANSKGGFVLQMLRCMMWEPKSEDADFRTMMRDYVQQFANRTASTEDFKRVVEKHMKPIMDLDGDRTMDWFFNEWIYGSDVPSYSLEYSLAPAEGGKTLLTGKLKQSGVSARFAMPVPIFADFGGKNVRVGVIPIRGNSTGEFKVQLPQAPITTGS